MSDAAKMQEASAPERIRFAASPLDPLAGRFTLERSLTRAALHFPDAAAASGALSPSHETSAARVTVTTPSAICTARSPRHSSPLAACAPCRSPMAS